MDRKSPEQVQHEIDREIKDLCCELKGLLLQMEPHRDMICSLKDELSSEEMALADMVADANEIKREISRLESKVVHREHDKTVWVSKDPSQSKLYF